MKILKKLGNQKTLVKSVFRERQGCCSYELSTAMVPVQDLHKITPNNTPAMTRGSSWGLTSGWGAAGFWCRKRSYFRAEAPHMLPMSYRWTLSSCAYVLWDNALVHCKDLSLVLVLIKCWLASSQAGSIGGATKLREFWKEKRQKQRKQDENASLRKKYQDTRLKIGKNYGLL